MLSSLYLMLVLKEQKRQICIRLAPTQSLALWRLYWHLLSKKDKYRICINYTNCIIQSCLIKVAAINVNGTLYVSIFKRIYSYGTLSNTLQVQGTLKVSAFLVLSFTLVRQDCIRLTYSDRMGFADGNNLMY